MEGVLTADLIYSYWYNTARGYCSDRPDVCKNLTDYMTMNKNWITSNQNVSDPYWYQVRVLPCSCVWFSFLKTKTWVLGFAKNNNLMGHRGLHTYRLPLAVKSLTRLPHRNYCRISWGNFGWFWRIRQCLYCFILFGLIKLNKFANSNYEQTFYYVESKEPNHVNWLREKPVGLA